MQMSAREEYLTTEVMTATPQRLQLLLIEAAIRSIEYAREHLDEPDYGPACEAIIRAEQIISEMLASLNHDTSSDLVKKVASVYLFVFRRLMEANHEHSEMKLKEALEVLNVERETWKQVCEKVAAEEKAGEVAQPQVLPSEGTSQQAPTRAVPPMPGVSTLDLSDSPDIVPAESLPSSGFSLEA